MVFGHSNQVIRLLLSVFGQCSHLPAYFLAWLTCALILAQVSPATAGVEGNCAEIQKEKARIYGFHPLEISPGERDAKSKQMDQFWKLIKAQGTPGLECLKQLISVEQQDGFFAFDASSLLLSLDGTPDSLKTALAGLQKTNLKDLDSSGYIRTTLFLLHKGQDITPLVEHYMKAPYVSGFVPQHAMKLDREIGALFLYGSMPLVDAEKSLVRLLNATEFEARSTATLILSLTMTEGSYMALKAVDHASLPEQVRKAVEVSLRFENIKIRLRPSCLVPT